MDFIRRWPLSFVYYIFILSVWRWPFSSPNWIRFIGVWHYIHLNGRFVASVFIGRYLESENRSSSKNKNPNTKSTFRFTVLLVSLLNTLFTPWIQLNASGKNSEKKSNNTIPRCYFMPSNLLQYNSAYFIHSNNKYEIDSRTDWQKKKKLKKENNTRQLHCTINYVR